MGHRSRVRREPAFPLSTRAWSNKWPTPRYPLAVVWISRMNQEARSLRRHAAGACPTGWGFHDASVPIGTFRSTLSRTTEGDYSRRTPRRADRRWPTKCAHCRYRFKPGDSWQLAVDRLYRYDGPFGRWLVTLKNAPPGSAYDAHWYHGARRGRIRNLYTGPDGIALVVVLPTGHPWTVDGPCSNCTRPNEPHKCWVRHGDPRDPQGRPALHVDKSGNTCSAGAGSIAVPGYHGFLQRGHLTAG